nr:spore coat associated protein CotJA [Anaerovorax sp. IOR16]
MAYVPMQVWNGTYEGLRAFERGTIFPDLDLPFSGTGVK